MRLCVADQPSAFGGVLHRRQWCEEPHWISRKTGIHRAAVRLPIPVGDGIALRPAFGTTEITNRRCQIGGQSEDIFIENHCRPSGKHRRAIVQSDESIENKRRLFAAFVKFPYRHVMAGMCVDGSGWKIVMGQRFRKRIDQAAEIILGPALVIAFSPVSRDQCTEQSPRLRRPSDIGFIDVSSPRRRVVTGGREAEAKCEHAFTSHR